MTRLGAVVGRLPLGLTPAVLFLLVFFLAPFVVLVYYSLATVQQDNIFGGPSLAGYGRILADPFTYYLFGRTIVLSFIVAILCLVFGYPIAYVYTRAGSRLVKAFLLGSVLTPLLTSSLVLTFGWIVILGRRGIINDVLKAFGVIEQPVQMLFTFEAVLVGMVQVHLPFMIVPLIATLRAIPPELEQAAADLGASRSQTFWHVTFQQSIPGVAAGLSLVFILAYTAFTVPTLLGGGTFQIVSVYIWNNVRLLTWTTAAAFSTLLLCTSLAVIVGFTLATRRLARWRYV